MLTTTRRFQNSMFSMFLEHFNNWVFIADAGAGWIAGNEEDQEEREGAHKPIIGLTAHAIQGYKDKCLSAGMDAYACKPFQARELIEVIPGVCKMWSVRVSEATKEGAISGDHSSSDN